MKKKIRIMTLTALLGLLAVGCTTTRYVPVESTVVRTDTLYKAVWHTDSVINSDTVRITEKGTEIVKWRIRTRELHDTIYQAMTDSVRVEVPYLVEKTLTRWEQAKMDLGGAAMGAALAAVCIAIIWLVKKFKRKN